MIFYLLFIVLNFLLFLAYFKVGARYLIGCINFVLNIIAVMICGEELSPRLGLFVVEEFCVATCACNPS